MMPGSVVINRRGRRGMSLSEGELHAWRRFEASLHKEFPDTPDQLQLEDPWTLTVSTVACRALMPKLILVIGVTVILAGVLIGVPLFVIAGIGVLCFRAGRTHRRVRLSAGGIPEP